MDGTVVWVLCAVFASVLVSVAAERNVIILPAQPLGPVSYVLVLIIIDKIAITTHNFNCENQGSLL